MPCKEVYEYMHSLSMCGRVVSCDFSLTIVSAESRKHHLPLTV